MTDRNTRHKASMEKLKARVDEKIAEATEQRGLLLINTGNGKGKTTAAWGTVTRALGYGYKVGVIQFIKGLWECGERNRLEKTPPSVAIMSTRLYIDTSKPARPIPHRLARAVMQDAEKMVWPTPTYHWLVTR